MNTFIIVMQKIKDKGISVFHDEKYSLRNDTPDESARNINQIVKILNKRKFNPQLITWLEYGDVIIKPKDLVIFPQWYVTGEKYPQSEKNLKKFKDQSINILNNPINSITLHRSGFIFKNIYQLHWKEYKTGMMKRQVKNIFINKEIEKLTDGVSTFIERNDFHKDYFERLSLSSAEVKPIISKTAMKNDHINFLTLGHCKHGSGANQFHLSVGFVGDDYTQTQFHNLLFNNILNYLYT